MGIRFLDEQPQSSKIRFLDEPAPSAARLSTAEAIPFISPEARASIAQAERNIRGGIVEGLGSIGSTVIRPFESAAENARRRALIQQFSTEVLGAEPDASGRTVGRVGTQIAGTAGLGPALGVGAARAGLPGLARALETGGFVGPSLPARIGAGAAVGGGAAAMTGEDIETGAGIGAVAGPALSGLIKAGAKGTGAAMDVLGMGLPQRRAVNVLREAIGEQNMPNAIAALRAAGTGIPDEALVGVSRPAFISLVDLAAKKDLDNTVNALRRLQGEDQLNELARLAGGITQTEARATREATKQNLRGLTAPMREQALSEAGLAGKYAPGLETDVSRFQGAATGKVEDVRMLERAKTTAKARAGEEAAQPQVLMGQRPDRSERLMQMADNAENYAAKSADESLLFGDAARFAKYQLDSLEAEGLKPLRPADFIGKVKELGKIDEMAGNDQFEAALGKVIRDIDKWTKAGGIISPDALYALRKNSVNSAIETLFKDPDSPAARQVAAGVLSRIKPIIDDAIEAAGGKGWRSYLDAFESGMTEVNQQKLAAKALDLFKRSPDEYVRLVRGDNPKEIEKVFGVGNYDIVKEMGAKYPTLNKLAEGIERRGAIETAIGEGREPIEGILQRNKGMFKLPAFFDPTVTASNRILTILGAKADVKTMDIIIKSLRSNEDLLKALEKVPAVQRNKVLKALSDDRSWIPTGSAVTAGAAVYGAE
jgi:hypothetical protein